LNAINPIINRSCARSVALETTLLVHGVPRVQSAALAAALEDDIHAVGAAPCLVGVLAGKPIIGMTRSELGVLLELGDIPKVNTSNLGLIMHSRSHGATTVSATMELCASAGVRVFATGGIGGVHRGLEDRLDISSDLAAFARWPVAVVASGVKSLLNVISTREALESLGVPVIGYQTDEFPAFYLRSSGVRVDQSFDTAEKIAEFIAFELRRTSRGVLICQPVPAEDEIERHELDRLISTAERSAAGATGRRVTPSILEALHSLSGGRTLRSNLSLVRSNARLAGSIANCLAQLG